MFGSIRGAHYAFLAHSHPTIGHTLSLPYTCAKSAEAGWRFPGLWLYPSGALMNQLLISITRPVERSTGGSVTDVAEPYSSITERRQQRARWQEGNHVTQQRR